MHLILQLLNHFLGCIAWCGRCCWLVSRTGTCWSRLLIGLLLTSFRFGFSCIIGISTLIRLGNSITAILSFNNFRRRLIRNFGCHARNINVFHFTFLTFVAGHVHENHHRIIYRVGESQYDCKNCECAHFSVIL